MLILKPLPYWEFSVLHLINFVIYLCALSCFDFFLCELIRYQGQTTGFSQDGRVALPEWAWLALGYSLFIWSSLVHIVLWMESPDMCMTAFVYLTSGILLRIRMGRAGWLTFVVLGAVLGFGYLAKAAMFPLAFLFLLVSLFSVCNLRRAIIPVLAALVVFFLVAGPFIVALSKAKGRLTFGDTGKLNYVWFVNCVDNWPHNWPRHWPHWQGELPGNGTPKHPARKIFDEPTIYEFGTPVGGTYPMWYDPSY